MEHASETATFLKSLPSLIGPATVNHLIYATGAAILIIVFLWAFQKNHER